ncbi:MAG: radical SAM family heme chaperone HemW [Syntrophomonadaceae bacterium]|nr:radical SAM family heme chaperone HemW [Syntrophomonadaceae bacterium]
MVISKYSESKIGLYIHVPFCIRKCSYCDFFSVPLSSRELLEHYTQAVLAEIELRALNYSQKQIETIYIGGGTPSLLSCRQLEAILQTVYDEFSVAREAEISIEANPAILNVDDIRGFKNAGINRLSLGVQSFFDEDLKTLRRLHDSSDVMKTIEDLRSQGLDNFNIDLIYGIPGQSIDRWKKNLEIAVDCAPRHISIYLLQLSPNTPMAREIANGLIAPLDEEDEWLMYSQGIDYLQEHGFKHYEISNFCRPGFECRHNLIYWQAREYLGIGPGAASFLDACRFMNKPEMEEYFCSMEAGAACQVEELEHMSQRELLVDAIILGLRLCEGIDLEAFRTKFNVDINNEYSDIISSCHSSGVLEFENGRLRLTRKGYFLSNEVFRRFID